MSLGTAYVNIMPSAGGLGKAITTELDTAGASAGKSSGMMIASKLKGVIGAAAIGAAIKKSITEGAALEQSLGGVETLYGKHANTIINNAKKAWQTAGISANSYMEQSTTFAASLLQSLGGNTKQAAKYADMAIIDMSDNANKFGSNISDIQNAYQGFSKQNYTMLDNLKLGYGGTKTEMERLLADASKLSGQEYDISNLSDVYEAIHVIQQEMGVTGTSAQEASTTLAGSFASMKAAATNFLGNLALGQNIQSSMSDLVSSASTFLFNNLIPALINIATALPDALFGAISSVIPQFIAKLPTLINQIFNAAKNIINSVTGFLDGFFDKIGNDPGAGKAAIELVKKLALGIIKGAASLVVAAAKLIATLVKGFMTLEGKMLKAGIKAAAGFVKGLKERLHGKIAEILRNLKHEFDAKLDAIKTAVKSKANAIRNKLTEPFEKAKTKIKNAINKIKGFFPIKVGKILSGLKLPHIKLSTDSFMGIKYPKFSVSWYKKGAIFNDPSIIGVGEAGKEAVVPLSGRQMKPFADAIAENLNGNGGNNYYFGDITLEVSSLEDVTTIEQIADVFRRAKAFA